MKAASSEARKATRAAISSGLPIRPTGTSRSRAAVVRPDRLTLERTILPDPEAVQSSKEMRLLKADVTRLGGRALLQELGATGPLTMVFLDASAQETPGTRLIGSVAAEAVINSARQVAGQR